MPRTRVEDEWDDDDDLDSEEEDYSSEEDDEDDTVPCPYCRKPVYEGAERCPHCESYLSEEDKPAGLQPTWILIGILLCLLIVAMWIFTI